MNKRNKIKSILQRFINAGHAGQTPSGTNNYVQAVAGKKKIKFNLDKQGV